MKKIIVILLSAISLKASTQCVQPSVNCPCDTTTSSYFLLTQQQYAKLERYQKGVNVFFGVPTINGTCIAISENALDEFKDTLDKLNIKKGFITTYRLTRCSISTFTCTTGTGSGTASGTTGSGTSFNERKASNIPLLAALISLPLIIMGMSYRSETFITK